MAKAADDYKTEYVWDHRNRLTSVIQKDNASAYSKLAWSHQGNKAATNGKGAALLRVRNPWEQLCCECVTRGKTPDQFSNWSKRATILKTVTK